MNEQTLFIEAMERPPAERQAFLDAACADDVELRQRVDRLIAAGEAADSFMSAPANLAAVTLNQAPAERSGAQIGPYKLLQQIGEGGMGIVYMAEQSRPMKRRVALKIIKPGMDTGQVIARFEAERQALAVMDHPNIARVLDAGTTAGGRPYFVMELVNGISITQFCDEQHLTTRERLELFVPICRAVQHAHQKGIIHRDLKPSNVLVALYDGKPVPKIIDFGVAKAVSQPLTERTMFTGFGQLVGTLEYMSPEQANRNQLDVDTRSDVYSLGVLLYELLAGETPFDKQRLRLAAMDELLRIIREEDPPRPSNRLSTSASLPSVAANRRIEPAKLSALVRGELDWIVMKAMEKDRGRRYDTASGLAMDVERYLADEPVQACPPRVVYRLGKFARRNMRALTMSAVVAVAILLVVGSVGWMVRDRDARNAEAARETADRQEGVRRRVETMLMEADQCQRDQRWFDALSAAERAQSVAAGTEADVEPDERVRRLVADLQFVQRLDDIRADRTTMIGDSPVLSGGESASPAAKDYDYDYAAIDRTYAAAFGEHGIDLNHLSVEEASERIRGHGQIAVALASALDDWASCRERGDDTRGAEFLLQVARDSDPDSHRRRIRSALIAKDLQALQDMASAPEAAALPPASIDALATGLHDSGRNDHAIDLLRRGQRAHPGNFGINRSLAHFLLNSNPPRTSESIAFNRAALALRPDNASAHLSLGTALSADGQLEEAIACARRAIQIQPSNASAYHNLGNALKDSGRPDEAIAPIQQAIRLRPNDGNAHNTLGAILFKQGEFDEAAVEFRRAIKLQPDHALAHSNLGAVVYKHLGQVEEAIRLHRKAIELKPEVANFHGNLGHALRSKGQLDEALASFRKAAELAPNETKRYVDLALVLNDSRKWEEVITALRKAIELAPQNAGYHRRLGIALALKGDREEAIGCYRRAIGLDPRDALSHSNLARELIETGDIDEAIVVARKAVELDPGAPDGHNNLGNALFRKGELDEPIACYRRAAELKPGANPLAGVARCNLGNTLQRKGMVAEAIVAFRSAIEVEPLYAESYIGLAHLLDRMGELDESVALLRQAVKIDPSSITAHLNLGSALVRKAMPEEAAESFRKCVELKPDCIFAHLNLAMIAIERELWDEANVSCQSALQSARTAVRLNPADPARRSSLTLVLQKAVAVMAWRPALKRFEANELLDLATEAMERSPAEPGPWSVLALARYRAADYNGALTALNKSVELGRGGDVYDHLLLALTHWRMDNKNEARVWLQKATPQIPERQKRPDQEVTLKRFLAEVELLGLEKEP